MTENKTSNLDTLNRDLSVKMDDMNKIYTIKNATIDQSQKIKFYTVDNMNFNEIYSYNKKLGQNYNTDIDSDLLYGIDTRRKTARDTLTMPNRNDINDNAAKILKTSSEYWDNTKRKNLDTSVYTDCANKIQGRGFGQIDSYGLLLNGIGVMTRQENPDLKPQNKDDDRLYLTNHNYNYDKQHVPGTLECGMDTRYLNKRMV